MIARGKDRVSGEESGMASTKDSLATAKELESQQKNSQTTDPIDQVRELLFGAAKRETSDQLVMLEQKLETMRKDFNDKLSTLESRLIELGRDVEKNQAASIDAIGGAIASIGATIQTMSARRKG